jgi:hypothetical protein
MPDKHWLGWVSRWLFVALLRRVPRKERTQDKASYEKFGAYDCFLKTEPHGLLDFAALIVIHTAALAR